MNDDELEREIGLALAERRPSPDPSFRTRLTAAVARRTDRRAWLPMVVAAGVAALAVVVIALTGFRATSKTGEPRPTVVDREPAGPAPGAPAAPRDVTELLAPYDALLARPDPALGLDAAQQRRLRDLGDALAKQRARAAADREVAMIELRRELDRGDVDPTKAMAILARVSDAEARIRRAELETRIAARAVLTDAQRARMHRRKYASDQCVKCHEQPAPRPEGLLEGIHGPHSSFPLVAGHARVPCAGCHTQRSSGGPVFTGVSPACDGCHRDAHAGQLGVAPE